MSNAFCAVGFAASTAVCTRTVSVFINSIQPSNTAYPATAPVTSPPQANLTTSEAIPATALFTIASAKSVPKRLFTSNPFL